MSTPSSKSSKKSSSSSSQSSTHNNNDVDVDMTSNIDDSTSVTQFPSTKIGSYLSQNYNPEVENKKVPGFICGQCYCLNTLKARESIRCRECGFRIMYKERLRRPMEYSAQ